MPHLSRATSALSRARRWLRPLTTPLVMDDYTSQVNDLWSAREMRGRIDDIDTLAEDTVQLTIRTGWAVPTVFQPGQHIGLGVQVNGRWKWRSYSLVNRPTAHHGVLTIAVREIQGGTVSSHIQRNVERGTPVRLAAPAGDFILPTPPPPAILFITAGSGITPIMSMLRTLRDTAAESRPNIIHHHIEKAPERVAFLAELNSLSGGRGVGKKETRDQPSAGKLDYHLELHYTAEGRPSVADMVERTPEWEGREIYACGPAGLLDDVAAVAEKHGRGAHVHRESFVLDRAHPGQGGTVSFGTRGTVAADGATSILEAAESIGIDLPHGCRMGVCSTCTIPLVDGAVTDLRTGEVFEPGQRIRACSCAAAGDCVIDVSGPVKPALHGIRGNETGASGGGGMTITAEETSSSPKDAGIDAQIAAGAEA